MQKGSQTELLDPENNSEQQLIKLSKSQIKKNIKINGRKSADDIIIAVEYLSQIIEKLKITGNGKPPSRKELRMEMKKIGFDISTSTLRRYKGKIKKVRSAVRDLLEEGTYSSYFDQNMDLLDYIEEQALECLNRKWTNSKMEKFVEISEAKVALDEGRQPNGVLVRATTTGEIAQPKIGFLNILAKVVDLRTRATNDDNLDLSCSMLSEEFQKTKDQVTSLEQRNTELEKELKSILRRKRKDTEQTSNN